MSGISIGKRRKAYITPEDLGVPLVVTYVKPLTPGALRAKRAVKSYHTFRTVREAGADTHEAATEAILRAEPSAEGDQISEDAMSDLASLCSEVITRVEFTRGGERGDLTWEDYGGKTWGDLSPEERYEVALQHPEVCVWSVALLLSRGADAGALGKSSPPPKGTTPTD